VHSSYDHYAILQFCSLEVADILRALPTVNSCLQALTNFALGGIFVGCFDFLGLSASQTSRLVVLQYGMKQLTSLRVVEIASAVDSCLPASIETLRTELYFISSISACRLLSFLFSMASRLLPCCTTTENQISSRVPTGGSRPLFTELTHTRSTRIHQVFLTELTHSASTHQPHINHDALPTVVSVPVPSSSPLRSSHTRTQQAHINRQRTFENVRHQARP
jgi:hypothetical protein